MNTLLSYAAANGNSARMMRSAALTLAVLVILLGLHFWQQDTSRRLLAPAVLVPFAAGFLCLGAMIWAALPIFPLRWGMGCISSGCIAVPSVKLWCRHCATSLPVWWGLAFRCCSSAGAPAGLAAPDPRNQRLPDLVLRQYPQRPSVQRGGPALAGRGSVLPCGGTGVCHRYFVCRSKRSAVLAAGGFALTLGMVLWNLLYGMVSASNNGPTGGAAALAAVLAPACIIKAVLLVCQR